MEGLINSDPTKSGYPYGEKPWISNLDNTKKLLSEILKT